MFQFASQIFRAPPFSTNGIRMGDVMDAQVIGDEAGTVYNPMADIAICRVTPEGTRLGGVLYTGWTGEGGSIVMHSASWHPRWINRALLWTCFDYPFNQLGVRKILGPTPSTNTEAMKLNEHLGFKPDAILKDVFKDGDMHVLSMYRENCRFLNLAPRKTRHAHGQQG